MLQFMAESVGLEARFVSDSEGFFRELEDWQPDFVSVDLVMPNLDGIELLRLLAKRQSEVKVVLMSGLGQRVIQTAEQLGNTLGLTIIGTLPKPFHKKDLEAVFSGSDLLLKRNAEQARSEMYIPDADLVRAIEYDEFVNHYQPQVSLSSGEATGAEGLIRWQHPEYGLVYPDDFISRIEGLGLIDELGWISSSRAFQDFANFSKDASPKLTLSLNISAHSLRNLEFPDRILSLAKEAGVAPQRTILEVTETGLVRDLTKTLDVLARLRMKGFELSIDDFGTGYSMMQQLKTIPATELKIDKLFVQNAKNSRSDRVMVTKTIEIGHELGMRVVAEGIETLEQLDFLRSSGSEIGQGYYFCRPQPVSSLVDWLHGQRWSSSLPLV
jgi:EAL domain-containing protein (putative c-di-GMP-specific phosphodiesterase class I)/ActR/RegA family two-component response regulator